MKRRTKTYLITHVAYDAKLRPFTKVHPITIKQWLKLAFFLIVFLYFTAGVLAAEVSWLPSNPSGNFSSFKRQVLLHNTNRVILKIKEADADVRKVDALAKSVETIKTTSQPALGIKTKLEVQPLKGYALYQIDYLDYTIASKFNGQYEVSLSQGPWKLRHNPNYTIMLDFSYSIP
jgi:hypothetical protein